MKIHHTPYHWISVAIVLAALMFTLSEAYGQSTGAAAAFEGRPSMAGAQAGLGAQAGPPQGGIGVQGTDGAQRSIAPRRQASVEDFPQGVHEPAAGIDIASAKAEAQAADLARKDARQPSREQSVKPGRDQGIAKDQRGAARKVKKAAKRTFSRNRQGINPIDAASNQAAR
jgi:hypothetical protein